MSEVQPGPEDLKIITLARSARARVMAAEGAAVRDETGRTYAAAAVALPSLRRSALHLAVAMGCPAELTAWRRRPWSAMVTAPTRPTWPRSVTWAQAPSSSTRRRTAPSGQPSAPDPTLRL